MSITRPRGNIGSASADASELALADGTGSLYTRRRSDPTQKFGFTVSIGLQRINNAMNGVSRYHKCSPPRVRIITWSSFDERVADSKGLYGGTTEPDATASHN